MKGEPESGHAHARLSSTRTRVWRLGNRAPRSSSEWAARGGGGAEGRPPDMHNPRGVAEKRLRVLHM
jgi:hypothetical protein